MKPRLLDLFCGAGGAAMGYSRAGFDVVGVDISPQPNFPFTFFRRDALEVLDLLSRDEWGLLTHDLRAIGFDAIHASPPCQAYTKARKLQGNSHPDLVAPTRDLLIKTGLPYVIENVPGSPLIDPVVIEGQMFPDLRTSRPRWFEANWPLEVPFLRAPRPKHTKMGRKPSGSEWIQVVGNFTDADAGRAAMGIDWMTRDELREAIPPAYTELIGHQLLQYLKANAPEA